MMIWGRLYRALDLGSPYVILFGQLFRDPVTWWWVNHWMLLCRWMLPSLDPLLIGKAKYQTSLFSQTTWFFRLWDNKPFGGFLGGKLLKLRCAYMCILYTQYISLQSQSHRKNPSWPPSNCALSNSTAWWGGSAFRPPNLFTFDGENAAPIVGTVRPNLAKKPTNDFLKMKHESIHKNPTFFARFWTMILQ